MTGLEYRPSPTPEVVAELKRGAVLGLLRLEIEAMLLRLEIEWMRRRPKAELFEPRSDPDDARVVRVDPDVWGSETGTRDETGRAATSFSRRRVFRLRGGQAALKARPPMSADPETLLAIARELVSVLEDEIEMPAQQDAA